MKKTKVMIRFLCFIFALMFCGVALAEEAGPVASETVVSETPAAEVEGGGYRF